MKTSLFQKLFVPGCEPGEEEIIAKFRMRSFKRRGQEFLLLPGDRAAALRGIELYSPLSTTAKFAIKFLKFCLKARLPLPLVRTVTIPVPKGSWLFDFLERTGGERGEQLPFAILAGNPRDPKRRFIVLTLNSQLEPVLAMKVGVGRFSSELVEREKDFVATASSKHGALPKVLDFMRRDEFAVLALDYMPSISLGEDTDRRVSACVGQWIVPDRKVKIGELPLWGRIEEECKGIADFVRLAEKLAEVEVKPVLFHGDFVPWNIRASREDGEWVVIDWERGESLGIPAWDWFHFEVQLSVLVRGGEETQIYERLMSLMRSRHFVAYAKDCQVEGILQQLLLLYLLYCKHVLRQTEGVDELQRLYQHLKLDYGFDGSAPPLAD